MSQRRFAVSLALSAAIHVLPGLLLYFDVMGPGGGFGIGAGPGVGIGQGGGFGLGKGKKRQIFALQDVNAQPAPPRRGKIEERLSALTPPSAPEQSRIALAGDLPVALPQRVSLPPASAAPRSDVAAKGTAGAVVFGGLGGAGGGGGFGISLGNFGRYVSELRRTGLDVVFVVDGTSSMGDVIAHVRKNLAQLVGSIQALVPVARIGFVVYRDRNDEVPIDVAPLTASRKKLDAFLSGVRADGGGDWPESLNLGLEAALERMPWRPDAKRLLVFVASSPPHDDEIEATIDTARRVRAAGGAVSAVDLSRIMHVEFKRKFIRTLYRREATPEELADELPGFYDEVRQTFRDIVRAGGGELIEFQQNERLVEHLLVLTFGTRWKEEVQQLAGLSRPQE
ncbi:MAG TPA: vWA domain-containing protein [Candidatus Binatia bacterium]